MDKLAKMLLLEDINVDELIKRKKKQIKQLESLLNEVKGLEESELGKKNIKSTIRRYRADIQAMNLSKKGF